MPIDRPTQARNFFQKIVAGVFAAMAAAVVSSSCPAQEPVSPEAPQDAIFETDWTGTRRWIGPNWWANPLTDWQMKDGQAVSAANRNRTLCLLAGELTSKGRRFELQVTVQERILTQKKATAAGFRIGRRGGIADYRHALVHATQWLDAAIRNDGRLVIGETVSKEKLPLDGAPIRLKLTGEKIENQVQLELVARVGESLQSLTKKVSVDSVLGGISLMTDGPANSGGKNPAAVYHFSNFSCQGDMLRRHEDRSFGPIVWTQYAIDKNRLRLLAQLAPIEVTENTTAELWFDEGDGQFQKFSESQIDSLSRTSVFTVEDWDLTKPRRYEVRLTWQGKAYSWQGTIRRAPTDDEPLRLACFSCDNGYLFPIPAMVEQVKRQDPDMLFFAGDQIYESYGGFGVARNSGVAIAMIDFLRKYYQFGWTWRELLKNRPSVLLTDDHDVFQGNIWGHGGRKLPMKGSKPDWTLGGYLMPGEWVNAVERCHVGHLPDPASDTELPIGIKPYYTSLVYGGVGFAILEDRKFKTGPKSLPKPEQARGEGADLLGTEQEAFLLKWSNDWTGQAMKCALSQTIFCNAATHTNKNLKRARYFFDSGAWPIEARNRAVRILGDCNALSIHGDQHLGVLLRQGVNEFDDAGYAFMVPGTANGFPRAWWPGVGNETPLPGQDYTGKFHDDAGHPIHVLAVGNPEPGSNTLPSTTDPMEIGYRKGSGYGLVEFDKSSLTAKVNLYRLGNEGETFSGFPKTIRVGGKPQKRP